MGLVRAAAGLAAIAASSTTPDLDAKCESARSAGSASARSRLAQLVAQAKLANELAIRVEIGALEVLQETAALANHLQESLPAVVVLGVRPEVIIQVVDPFREHRDLDLRRAGVGFVPPGLREGGGLRECHVLLPVPIIVDFVVA